MGKNYKQVLNVDFVPGAVPGISLGSFPRGYGTIPPQLYYTQHKLSANYRILTSHYDIPAKVRWPTAQPHLNRSPLLG
jgi:hypothetical protein